MKAKAEGFLKTIDSDEDSSQFWSPTCVCFWRQTVQEPDPPAEKDRTSLPTNADSAVDLYFANTLAYSHALYP